ncbi:bifunctional UDP-sugar hydrolase/5'-nucleotidase UshA [Vibrio sp.]|nr:bifunctional UDP-sugar hydrolase/5'-nucleotidase UshA [Vibrio sp.]
MKSRHLKIAALSAAVAGAMFGCSSDHSDSQASWEQDKVYKFTVLHTNDHHGRFWKNNNGEYGMAARKTLIDKLEKEIKAEGGEVLLLSGGDINTGVPESDLQDAEPDFKGMNLIGYDAMAVGNHEFDNSLEVLFKQKEWAKFPMLSANIYYKDSEKRLFDPYTTFEVQGLKVAVIGLTTEDTAKIVDPKNIKDVEFRDPKVEAKKVIDELNQTEKPDLVFAVTHMGHYADGNNGINAPGDVALARSLEEGDLDMIVGGHSQEPVCMEGKNQSNSGFKAGDECVPDKQNGTYIVQAHEWGKYVGRADYEFVNGELNMVSYDLIPVNLKKKVVVDGEKKRVFIEDEIAENKEMLALLSPYQEKGAAALNIDVAQISGRLEGDRNIVRFQQTNLGRLIATSHMERAKADFGIMNSGGVRASMDAGTVTYKDVLTVQPFSNLVTYADMTGKEIIEYLNQVATKPIDSGSYAQFAGISMTVENGQVSDVQIGGEALVESQTYRFSIPGFNAGGGDGYPDITGHSGYVDTGFVDAEVLKEYLENNSPVDVSTFEPSGEINYK